MHARLHAVSHSGGSVAVRGDTESQPLGVLHRCLESGRGVLRSAGVGSRSEAAARGHYLDVARAQLELLSHRLDNLVGSIRLRAEHVAVPAGCGYGRTCHYEARSGDYAVFDCPHNWERHLVACAEIAHGGDARG